MMLDVERTQPALLAHGQRHEIADLDQLRLAEMLVQARPEFVVDRQVPGDRLRIGERRLLLLVVAGRALEVDQVAIVVFHDALARRFHGALVAAILAFDRARHVDAAELLDRMVGDAVLEYVAPGVCKRPEHVRHMGADRLAFRPWRALAAAAVELRQHRLVFYGCGVHIADPWLRHCLILRLGSVEQGRACCRMINNVSTPVEIVYHGAWLTIADSGPAGASPTGHGFRRFLNEWRHLATMRRASLAMRCPYPSSLHQRRAVTRHQL